MIEWSAFLAALPSIFLLALHLWLSVLVWADARVVNDSKGGAFLRVPALWGFIALVTGILGLALYWLVHYSSLRSRPHR